MAQFCGPRRDDAPIKECAVDIAGLVVPTVFVAAMLPSAFLKWWRIRGDHKNRRLWVRFSCHTARWILTLILLFFQALEVSEGFISGFLYSQNMYLHLYLPCLVAMFTTGMSLVLYDFCETFNLPRGLTILFLYWNVMALLKILKLFSLPHLSYTTAREFLNWTILVVTFLLTCLEVWTLAKQVGACLCENENDMSFYTAAFSCLYLRKPFQRYVCDSGHKLSSPKELDTLTYVHPHANFLSRATWNWITPMLVRGYKETLKMSDLGNVPQVSDSQ